MGLGRLPRRIVARRLKPPAKVKPDSKGEKTPLTLQVAFVGMDGKESAPQPLPKVRRVAIWPGDAGDVRFAEKLTETGRFDVTTPGRVSAILSDAKITPDLGTLTTQEQTNAFATVCRQANVDLIFASHALGASSATNTFSFSRANVTYKADLLGFSCTANQIVWRDQIAVIIGVGSTAPSAAEINDAGASAWADRVMQAISI